MKHRELVLPKSLDTLKKLSWEDFEYFLFDYYKYIEGYEVRLTERFDYGIDLLLFKKETPHIRYGIQAKQFYKPVKEITVLKAKEAKDFYYLKDVWVITTDRFTRAASRRAINQDVRRLDIMDCKEMIVNIRNSKDIKL